MPRASEKASAIAIVKIPPRTANFECVPECKPTIKPKVVIIPEVMPKLNPTSNECFIKINKKDTLNNFGFLNIILYHKTSFFL